MVAAGFIIHFLMARENPAIFRAKSPHQGIGTTAHLAASADLIENARGNEF